MNIQQRRKANVTITFETPAAAVEWFNAAQAAGLVSDEAALVRPDGLDDLVGDKGVPGVNRFLVRRAADRPYGQVEFADRIRDVVVVRS